MGMVAACGACGEALAMEHLGRVSLRAGLVERPTRHDELPTYGLRDAARLRGKSWSRSTQRDVYQREGARFDRELYIYCPRCGRGQHLKRPNAVVDSQAL